MDSFVLLFSVASSDVFPIRRAGERVPGFPQHPHRGFETITATMRGIVDHTDSLGNAGRYGHGDVQWMTAARGIIREEFHSTDFQQTGGVFEMCQLWLNLASPTGC